jgi:DNA-binding transcriptional ArsR family regulator
MSSFWISFSTQQHLYTRLPLKKDMPDEKLARALGSRVRRDMIHALMKQEISVHEIAEKFNISEVNSSKHLKLYDFGILNTCQKGCDHITVLDSDDKAIGVVTPSSVIDLIKEY